MRLGGLAGGFARTLKPRSGRRYAPPEVAGPFGFGRRLAGYVRTIHVLRRANIRYLSILLYPLRRRGRDARCELKLEQGLSLVASVDEHLVQLVEEVLADDCYRLSDTQLRPGEVIVDIGANVGTFAMAAAAVFPEAPIVCVEPSPIAYASLQANVERNNLRRIATVRAACGRESGVAMLYSRALHLRSASAFSTLYTSDNFGSVFLPVAEVPVIRLDELFRAHRIEACGLLKLDCEGAEYDILLNASEPLLSKIRQIAVEYHVGLTPHQPEELAERLERDGFETDLQPLVDEEGGYLYASR
jgi:FkbM family methyltransferase